MMASLVVVTFVSIVTPTLASADTCLGALGIFSAFSSACPCPEVCTGGTGSCEAVLGAPDRCTGSCEEQCDPSQCGTDACAHAAAEFGNNAEHMVTGLMT